MRKQKIDVVTKQLPYKPGYFLKKIELKIILFLL